VEIKKLNLRRENDKPLKIKSEEIPDLVPPDILNEWMNGDDNPYFKVQKIDYPILANGYTYVESFFESFIEKLNRAPIPGSKDGHLIDYGKRADTDFILVGAKIDKKKNGKGSVYLKNYIPLVGESGDNAIFLKELKSNMIDFSLVAYTKDERIENGDGSITWNVIESVTGERNDAVPYGLGAMEQKTNAVEDGENNNREKSKMKKDEVLEALKTLKVNAEITLPEIAKALNLEVLLLTDEQRANLSKLNLAQKEIGNTDILDWIVESKAVIKKTRDTRRENALTENFGAKVFAETQKENEARAYAEKICVGKELTDDLIKEVKADPIFKKLNAQIADANSDVNDMTGIKESNRGTVKGGLVAVNY
jgi:hypothetical protein